MMPRVSAVLLATLAVAAAQAPLPGLNSQLTESPVTAALDAARARLGESLTIADRTVTFQWLTSLAELEKNRAAAGDYEGAQRARLRRELAAVTAGSADGRIPVPLPVRSSTNKGTGLTATDGQTAEFRASGAFMEWDVSGDFKGWYEVLLTHSVMGGKDHSSGVTPIIGPIPAAWRKQREESGSDSPTFGGWASFQSISSLSGSNMVLRREIVSTGGWNSYRTVSLGRIQIQPSNLAKFRLTGEEAGARGLMHFRQIELVPVSAPSDAKSDGQNKLARGRDWFEKEFSKGAAASSANYRAKLLGLEQQAVRTKDNDLLVRVRDEVKRLTNSPAMLALSSDEEIASTPSGTTLTVTNSFSCLFRGDTVMDNSKTFLTRLRPAGSGSVTWRLPAFNLGSGVYEVAIKCRVPVNGGGTATLAAFAGSGVAAGKPLKFEVKPVVTADARARPLASGEDPPTAERRTEEPGKIVIGKNAETLTLTVNSLTHATDGWLLDLTSVTLNRVGDVPPEKSTP